MKKAFRTNEIVSAITDEQMQQIESAETAYENLVMPFLGTLTKDERLHMAKIGTGNIDFTTLSIAYGQANRDLVPSFLDIDAAAAKLALFKRLQALQQQRAAIDRAIADTMMECGSFAYTGGLAFYESAQAAADRGQLGAIAIVEDLAPRLPVHAARLRKAAKGVKGVKTDAGSASA